MTVTLKDHWDMIKAKCYNNSPSQSAALDEIWNGLAELDRYNDGSAYIQPMADEVVHLVWNLHGCPEVEHDWPVPPPPPPPPPPENDEVVDGSNMRAKGKAKGKSGHGSAYE